MSVIGLDVGGANLKVSDGRRSTSLPFAMWRQSDQLRGTLVELIEQFDRRAAVAVAMTGELADCFETKRQGVQCILTAVEQAAAGREVRVWQTGGEFVTPDEARELTPLVAAANWHALATWAGRMAPVGPSLLIDIGSTTTDIIPLENGLPMPIGRTDPDRLASGELLYLGVRRTPICSLLSEITFRGRSIGIAREVFATTLDANLVLGLLPEDPLRCDTANGRPATRSAAEDRLARMLCADRTELDAEEILALASGACERARNLLQASLEKVLSGWGRFPASVLLAGEGEFLAQAGISRFLKQLEPDQVHSLEKILGPVHSRAACAYALTQLATERNRSHRS